MLNEIKSKERYIILDVLRGIALLGICVANFPEFALYTFQKKEVIDIMPTASIDRCIKYLLYIFIDGKFYTLFSLLFGVGFSIMMQKANGFYIFYRRMFILALIGLSHLLLLWAGDILILYALLGMLLPLFRNTSNKKLLLISITLVLFPIVVESIISLSHNTIDLALPFKKANLYFNHINGITDDNFGVWLLNGKTYCDILKFNLSGAFIRCQEFIDGNRIFKVLGLFLFGLYIGRTKIYVNLDKHINILKIVRNYGLSIGLPLSCLYAWGNLNNKFGLIINAIIYAISVIPLSLGYASAICLWYNKNKNLKVFNIFAAPGRMALTNYISQSVFGIIIFYGVGFALAITTGLVYIEIIAVAVFLIQIIYSLIWLYYFKFGPLEWLWRILTYGKYLNIRK